MMKLSGYIFLVFATISSCKKQETIAATTTVNVTKTADNSLTYLALGDSYTIGQSVPLTQSFPYQLASQLRLNNLQIAEPQIIAQTGWTTVDLKRAIAAAALTKKFDFVSLLIGVNNQFQGLDTASYRTDFVDLVKTALFYANNQQKRVFVLSIPDYSVTPFAAFYDTTAIKKQINTYNAINEAESKKLGVQYLNITDISRQAKTDNSLVADDGLHPSAKMYMLWVKLLKDQVIASLK